MPSRCIFFLSALRAWSTLLSRTRTCTLAPSLFRGRVEVESPAITGLLSRAAIAEKGLRVHRSVPEMPAPWPFFHVGSGVSAIWLPHAPVSYTHLRAHETRHDIVCRLLL